MEKRAEARAETRAGKTVDKFVLDRLARSQLFQEYERAFGEATGLPLSLSAVEDWHLAHHGQRHENPFCALLARQSKACAACLRTQAELARTVQEQPRTVECFAGLCETAVPLRVGEKLIGVLRTGEVLLHQPNKRQFAAVVRQLAQWTANLDVLALRQAYFRTRVLSPKQYNSIVRLLKIFAEHLSLVANQMVFQSDHSEPPNMTRARLYMDENKAENLSLQQVATAVNMSSFYFCKKFHQAVGCTFTEYLARIRVEAAKSMLLNPNTRVSEVAFEAGFQSITHFNRVFRKLVGQSPTDFRAALRNAA